MPKHVYELAVLERFQEPLPPLSMDTFASAPTTSESCEFVLLRPARRTYYFLRVQEVHVNSGEISLKLLPESSEEIEFLRSLKTGHDTTFAFAHRNDATWVALQWVAETPANWEMSLKKIHSERERREATFGDFTSDEIAALRAKRILLDDKLSVASPWLFEYHVSNAISSQYEHGLAVHKSPLPQLYRTFHETPEHFKKFAYLVSVFYLKLTNTVEEILQLELALREEDIPVNLNGGYPHPRYQTFRKGPALKVRFKGRRHQYFSIRPATLLEFEGICPLVTGKENSGKTEG